jgi:hypothetical protein
MLRAHKRPFIVAGVFILILNLSFHVESYADESDPVIRFYLDNLDYVFERNFIFNSDTGFLCNVESILETTDYRGKTDKIDTAVFRLYYNDRILDSSSVLDSAKSEEHILPINFFPPRLWIENMVFDFYPNDTGDGKLAINFESFSLDSSDAVVGFINLDRNNYFIKELFLHYPNPEHSERISEIYIFERSGNLILLRQFERQTAELRFFGRLFTKRTLIFSDYHIR